MKFLIDDNIVLKVLEQGDAPALFALVDQNRSHLRQWLPWLDQNKTVEDSRAYIEAVLDQRSSGKGFACGVFFEQNLAGICGYHEIDAENQTVVIGYWLAENLEGRGIITRCTKFFLDYAFDELRLKKVSIPVAEQNTKSRAVCERLGLTSEGVEPDAEFLYDRYVNHVRYSVLKEAWLALRQQRP